MRNKHEMWLYIVAAATIILAGCNEPNGSSPRAENNAPAVASPGGDAGVEVSALSPYTPGGKVLPLTSCNLERVDGATFGAGVAGLPVGQTHSFSGWVAAPQLDKPAYQLRFDNQETSRHLQAPVRPSIARRDVTDIAGYEAFSPNSGFKVDVPSGALSAGRYHVYLVAITGDTTYSCDNGRQISVGE